MKRVENERTANADELLRKAAIALALPAVASIWEDLVSHLGRAIDVDWVVIGELPPGGAAVVKTLAAWHQGKLLPNFEFPLEPRDELLSRDVCLCNGNLEEEVPKAWLEEVKPRAFGRVSLRDSLGRVRGLLIVAHSEPFENPDRVEAVVRIFAFKAATELERALEDETLYREVLENAQGSQPR
jgi:hypothetical protein